MQTPLPASVRRRRRVMLPLLAGSSLLLVPWAVYLALTLPERYVAARWEVMWSVYDVVLAVLLGVTAWLAWRRRLVFVVTAAVAGAMLWVDAWFDVMSAEGSDLRASIVAAVLLELPLGTLLLAGSTTLVVRIARAIRRLEGSDGGWWQLLLPAEATHPVASRTGD